MKCTACGSTNLVEGTIGGYDTADIPFRPRDTALLKRMFGTGTRPIRAYGCIRCHHLQLAVEFSEEDLRRYQEFEGQQPSLLERLGAEPSELKE